MASKRIKSNLYMEYKFKKDKVIRDPNGYLFANGIYPTKIKADDLPEWFVFGYMHGRHGYISTKGVVDLLYRPNYIFDNHLSKYDNLYISYSKPIRVLNDSNWNCCENYDEVISGPLIFDFLDSVQQYSDIDITPVVIELQMKLEFYHQHKNADYSECIYDWLQNNKKGHS